jgi:hypothetical protein
MLVVIVLDGLWSWRFALQENPCHWFPQEDCYIAFLSLKPFNI